MSEHERKFDAAMDELARTKMWGSNVAPPILKVQRRLGWLVRPPHYAPFWRVLLGYTLWFGPVWGVMMWFISWRGDGVPVLVAIGSAAFAGVFFGAMMALYYAWGRRKYKLSRWEDL